MSKSVKTVIGVAAAIFVPYFAPAIAGSIGLSGAVSGALSSMGLSTAAGSFGASLATGISGGLVGAGLGAAAGEALGYGWKKGALMGGLGGGLAGYSGHFYKPAGAGVNTAGAAGTAGAGEVGGSAATVSAAPAPEAIGAQVPANVNVPPIQSQSPGVMAALKQLPSEIAAKFSDPKAWAELTMMAAAQLAGAQMAAQDALMPGEQQLLDAMKADLAMQKSQDAKVYNLRLSEAEKLLNEADYYDPEYLGKQQARKEQVRGGLAKSEALRGVDQPDKRVAEGRRFDLATSRNTGTAFTAGYGMGVDARTKTRLAGLSALPNAYPSYSGQYTELGDMYDKEYTRRKENEQGYADFITPFFAKDESTGDNRPTVFYNLYTQPPQGAV